MMVDFEKNFQIHKKWYIFFLTNKLAVYYQLALKLPFWWTLGWLLQKNYGTLVSYVQKTYKNLEIELFYPYLTP